MSITREEIVGLVAEYSALGQRGVADTNTTATKLVDAALAQRGYDIKEGSPLYCYYDAGAGGAAPEEEQGWVTNFANATGTLDFLPTATAAITASDKYELWKPCVEDRDRVTEAINRVLTKRCHFYQYTVLGMLKDGDCEAVTNWTVSGDPVRAVTAFALPYRNMGANYIKYTASADGGGGDYIYQELQVTPGKTYEIAVAMRVEADTTGACVVYDLVATANLTLSGDTISITGLQSSGSDWEVFRATFTPPSTCDRVSVRVDNDTHSGVTDVAFVAVWPQEARSLPVPDRVPNRQHIMGVYRWQSQADPEGPGSWHVQTLPNVGCGSAQAGLYIDFHTTLGSLGGPFFIDEKTYYAALTDDDATDATGTTTCPDDYVAYLAADELLKRVIQKVILEKGLEAAEAYRYAHLLLLPGVARVRAMYERPPGIIVWR